MDSRTTRRTAVGKLIAALSAAAAGFTRFHAEGSAEELCNWYRASGTVCSGGVAKQYWCYHCCEAGSGCQDVYCEWRIVGPC